MVAQSPWYIYMYGGQDGGRLKEPREETSMMTRIDRWLLLVICATAISCALPYDVSRHPLKSSKYSPFPIPSKVHQEMSSPTRTIAAPCSSCGRVLPVRRNGNIRTHGPVANQCPGSGYLLPSRIPRHRVLPPRVYHRQRLIRPSPELILHSTAP